MEDKEDIVLYIQPSPNRREQIQTLLDNNLPCNSDPGSCDQGFRCTHFLKDARLAHIIQAMAHSTEEFVRHVWLSGWQVVNFNRLPAWLKDNDLLIHGHRPQLNNVWDCVKSIFRIHTETGNIWTHLLGCFGFLTIAIFMLTQRSSLLQWQDKVVFSAFFIGAVCCLGFSCLFHTIACHSENIGRIMNKLDYAGIAFLTLGSFVPYLYYSFYCRFTEKVIYLVLIGVLATAAVVISMSKQFASPKYRTLRAGVFIALGLSGVIPCIHIVYISGFWFSVQRGPLGWLVLMAVLYITGASIYAARIPERYFPGKFDLWFQSHQIFHVFVIVAAFVHLHGLVKLSDYYLTFGDCQPDRNICAYAKSCHLIDLLE